MRVHYENAGTTAIAIITGEVDLANGSQFADEVLARMPAAASALVVDLVELKYIDSAGVRSLFEIGAAVSTRDDFFAIAVPEGSPLRSVLKMTQVEEIATVCATREEALDLALTAERGREGT